MDLYNEKGVEVILFVTTSAVGILYIVLIHLRSVRICNCVLQMISPLNFEQAVSARDALAKAVYGRTFTWLVEKINQSLAPKVQLCF